MNYADLMDTQDDNRNALGQAFADAGTKSAVVTLRQRKEAEAAVRAEQTKAFEDAIAAHLDKTATEADHENGPEGQE